MISVLSSFLLSEVSEYTHELIRQHTTERTPMIALKAGG